MDTQAPARLQSDNGKEFVAGIILELCQAFGVTAINGAIGKPQSQGCVERSNRTVKDKISAQLQMAPTIAWRYQVQLACMPGGASPSILTACCCCCCLLLFGGAVLHNDHHICCSAF